MDSGLATTSGRIWTRGVEYRATVCFAMPTLTGSDGGEGRDANKHRRRRRHRKHKKNKPSSNTAVAGEDTEADEEGATDPKPQWRWSTCRSRLTWTTASSPTSRPSSKSLPSRMPHVAAEDGEKKDEVCTDAAKKGTGSDSEDDEQETQQKKEGGLSNKQKKLQQRMKIAELKQICNRPDVLEVWDATASDPKFLVYLKSYRNIVPVPRHWC